MPDEQKLLPCPFCGAGNPRHVFNSNGARLTCGHCSAEAGMLTWNSRVPLPGVVTLSGEEAGKIKGAIFDLYSVLCSPDGKCCIDGSDGDRAVIDGALNTLRILTRAQKEG